ncbi:hypothetical protein [Paenibacillus sp. BAC0078]
MKKTTTQGGIFKKTSIAAASAAALGLGIVSTGNNELRSAADNDQITKLGISDTHEGATLTVAEAYHDGKSLSIALTREGLTTNEDRLVGESAAYYQLRLRVQKNAALLQITRQANGARRVNLFSYFTPAVIESMSRN